MQLSVSTNFPDVVKRLEQLHADLANTVLVRTVNRTAEQAKTAMSRSIRREFNLPAEKVNEKLFVKRASFKAGRFNVEAELLSRDAGGKRRSINVINFDARVTRQGQLTVKIKRAGARKPIAGAFIGNKGRTVFVREGKRRLPIRPVQTIDVAQMFNSHSINREVVRLILTKFPEVFEREAQFALSKWSKA